MSTEPQNEPQPGEDQSQEDHPEQEPGGQLDSDSQEEAETLDEESPKNEPSVVVASTAAVSGAAPKREGSEPHSAGARVAAARAAKAAEKAAKKSERGAQQGGTPAAPKTTDELLRSSPLGRWTLPLIQWFQANRVATLVAFGATLLAIGGYFAFRSTQEAARVTFGRALQSALETSNGTVAAAGESTATPVGPTFESATARRAAALTKFQRAASRAPAGSRTRALSLLGQAATLVQSGQAGEARTLFEQAARAAGAEVTITRLALEGIAASYEGERDWAHAIETYERLRSNSALQTLADFQVARVRLLRREGRDVEEATQSLRTLTERLDENEETPESADLNPYVRSEVRTLLRELDPSAAGPETGMDNEELQRLIQQLQRQQRAG